MLFTLSWPNCIDCCNGPLMGTQLLVDDLHWVRGIFECPALEMAI